ncbi:WXG100 family type VII secretion target [Streptomyces mirabilis]
MTTDEVSLEQMEFVGGEMEAISSSISRTLQTLDNGAKMNLAQWEDGVRDVYLAAKTQWDAAAAAMHDQSLQARMALGNISGAYTNGERYGVNIWNQ